MAGDEFHRIVLNRDQHPSLKPVIRSHPEEKVHEGGLPHFRPPPEPPFHVLREPGGPMQRVDDGRRNPAPPEASNESQRLEIAPEHNDSWPAIWHRSQISHLPIAFLGRRCCAPGDPPGC